VFASDGAIWEENQLPTFLFTWITRNEIASVITNQIQPLLITNAFTQFYYANFVRPNLLVNNLTWIQSTTLANETTGYFRNELGFPATISTYSSTNTQYIQVGSLVKFAAPAGYYFDANNRLRLGIPTLAAERLELWASPVSIYLDGTNQGQGNFTSGRLSGQGPVVLNNFIPTGAIPVQVIPLLITDIPSSLESAIVDQVLLYRNFGLGYDNLTQTWYLITSNNLAVDADFSLANAQSTTGTNQDASWMIQAVTDGVKYTVTSRALVYNFGSVLQTRFFFETGNRIYDPRTGKTISDYVNVLRTNSLPDSNSPLPGDIYLSIIGQPVQSDGYVDDYQVIVSYRDSDSDGIADDPDFFDEIVAPDVNPTTKYVFFEKTVDFDNLQRYLLVDPARVNSDYATQDDIELVKNEYILGQIFYAYDQEIYTGPLTGQIGAFYELVLGGTPVKTGVFTGTASIASNTTLTITAVTAGTLTVGTQVTGTGIPVGAFIVSLGTGTGGAGTYVMSVAATATTGGVTITGAVNGTSGTNVRTLVDITADWLARVGRPSIYFQYRHNAPLTDRIDPGTTNIIDLYVVTQSYYTAYTNWIRDSTGTVPEPEVPTINELSTAYQGLNNYKMISDNVVVNSVTFKPLFGAKAPENLRATIKVIRAANSTASESEIKTSVVANLNQYFSIDAWNFGDIFYFSELAAYIHRNMGGVVSSVVLVPVDPLKYFGDLYEIRSAPNEIFVNAAGVGSIEVITALTSTNIRTAPGSGVI
jgi:hypothetical protein